jgi:hypothetical protein
MIKQLLLSICLFAILHSHASDSLTVLLNGNRFQKGDTISFDCIYRYSEKKAAASTLNVWIEDIAKNRKWQYRYPLVNGAISANLVIGNELPDGKYAVNFLVQNQFFGVKGKIRDYNPKTKGLIYIMLTKNKDSYIDNLKTNADGSFSLPKLQFADSARFIFSQVGKKRNDLLIDIATPLDSTFSPVLMNTQFITVGNPNYAAADTVKPYVFNEDIFKKPFTIEGVTVKSIKKKRVEQFDQEYSNGLFSGGDARIFDGIDGNEIGNAIDIFTFLQGRVAGLTIGHNDEGGINLSWRGTKVALYLDEFKIEPEEGNTINPMDVAMIKVFSPGSGGPTNGGAIAIYTKRGAYGGDTVSRKYYFIVKGFTPAETVWR